MDLCKKKTCYRQMDQRTNEPTDGPTNGLMDGPTDTPSHRNAYSRLKKRELQLKTLSSSPSSFLSLFVVAVVVDVTNTANKKDALR